MQAGYGQGGFGVSDRIYPQAGGQFGDGGGIVDNGRRNLTTKCNGASRNYAADLGKPGSQGTGGANGGTSTNNKKAKGGKGGTGGTGGMGGLGRDLTSGLFRIPVSFGGGGRGGFGGDGGKGGDGNEDENHNGKMGNYAKRGKGLNGDPGHNGVVLLTFTG
ncbi:hypothetical protein CTZ27_12135 [Streptomyces griseocarneus]|nr:hypothetical protein CTZ27_12135 [Streptomyces griseocarneus]